MKLLGLAFVLALGVAGSFGGQNEQSSFGQANSATGQNVVPVFEGWEPNPDGSFEMIFGYFNRNWDEVLDLPIGAANAIEPGGPDQGQPTHFYVRRNRFYFRVRVPGDWGKKDLVWTLTSNGKTDKAYGTLHPELVINSQVISVNYGGGGLGDPINKAPNIRLEGPDRRTIRVGEPLLLSAIVADDGIPKLAPSPNGRPPGRYSAKGLRVAWIHYRGAGTVTFDPPQFKISEDPRGGSPWSPGWKPPPIPPGGKHSVNVRFSAPGVYVVGVLAHDGFLSSRSDVTVTVN